MSATALLACAGCGDATLTIILERVAGDDPFAGTTQIEAVVVANGELLAHRSAPVPPGGGTGGGLDLDPIRRHGDVVLMVTGYDANGDTVSAGGATADLGSVSGTCCLRTCFCSLPLFDSGACSCSVNGCGACP